MFFITGLPRSRTAWFAELFNDGTNYCHHELCYTCKDWEDFESQMNLDYKNVGNSDERLLRTDFQERFPDTPLVIIHRDPALVNKSLNKAGCLVPLSMLEENAEKLKELDGLHIQFDEINDRLAEIWEYCIGSKPDEARLERFKKLNIQTNVVRGGTGWYND